jgi:hypothetical protein
VTLNQHAAVVASTLLLLLALFQMLLAAGVPWGRAAWRGAHRVLPPKLRWASLAAAPILLFAAWVVLARSDLVAPGSSSYSIRILTWAFAVYFSLNTVGNLSSESNLEKWLMTPVALVLAGCFFALALA